MLKMFYIIVFVAIMGILQLQAQCCGSSQKMIQQITASPLKMYYLHNDGLPFYSDEWLSASLMLTSGEVYEDLDVRLDLFKDELVYFNSAVGKQLVIDKESISEFHLKVNNKNKDYLIRNICTDDSSGYKNCDFYFIHVSDSISLWSKHKKKEVIYNNISNLNGAQGYYYEVVKYYILINNQKISMPSKKRKLAKLFPHSRKAIVSYIKKKGLNLTDDYDLSMLFEKINEWERGEAAALVQ